MGFPEAPGQRPQRLRNVFPLSGAQFFHALSKARVKVDPHSLPLKAFVWPAARALRTSDLTDLYARSACLSLMPYSCKTKSSECTSTGLKATTRPSTTNPTSSPWRARLSQAPRFCLPSVTERVFILTLLRLWIDRQFFPIWTVDVGGNSRFGRSASLTEAKA